MADAALKIVEPDEFFQWCLTQEDRYELVDGVPVMMTGASSMHDTIVVNVIAMLHFQLRGSRCRPTTADTALKTKPRSRRRPDVMVTCDPPRNDVYEALEPRMAVEVLSPSNTGADWERKLEEYRQHTPLDYILLVQSKYVESRLFVRSATGWDERAFNALDDVIDFPEIACTLRLADVYARTGLLPLQN